MNEPFINKHYVFHCSCLIPYSNRDAHNCCDKCKCCLRIGCKVEEFKFCPYCNARCNSTICLSTHLKEPARGKSICKRNKKRGKVCPECKSRFEKDHKCYESMCSNCNEIRPWLHKCYIRSPVLKKPVGRYIFYDIESDISTGVHIPDLVCIVIACDECKNEPITKNSKCENCGVKCEKCDEGTLCLEDECGKRLLHFFGESCITEFCLFLLNGENTNMIAISHNGSRYDTLIVLNGFLKLNITPSVVFRGTSLITMHVKINKITFIDSYLFISMPLASFPKAFNIVEEKGYYPLLLPRVHTEYSIMDRYPDKRYYMYDKMSDCKKKEFDEWYEQNKDNKFDIKNELLKYCYIDTIILAICILKFRNIIKDLTVVPPNNYYVDIFHYKTIAGVAITIFKSLFLKERWEGTVYNDSDVRNVVKQRGKFEINVGGHWFAEEYMKMANLRYISSELALVPQAGYNTFPRYSKKSIEWLLYYQHKHNVKIRTALSPDGEMKILNDDETGLLSLDGFYHDKQSSENIALEFQGCFVCIKVYSL